MTVTPPARQPGPAGRQARAKGARRLAWTGAAALVAVLLAIDSIAASRVTGAMAALGMALALAGLTTATVQLARDHHVRLGRSIIAQVAILLLALGLLLGRVFLVLAGSEATASAGAARTYDLVFAAVSLVALLFTRLPRTLAALANLLGKRPALVLAGSFAAMIAVGTLLLVLPISVRRVADVSFIDSLFTMTSAVCVTGLVVNEVGETYTFFGQLVILGGIQLGGIGIMTIAALVPLLRRDGPLETRERYASMLEARHVGELRSMVAGVLIATLAIEALGALGLWGAAVADPTLQGRPLVWPAIFHSISAFCNAGFALYEGNLVRFAPGAWFQLVIMALIVLGGLGFGVLREVWLAGLARVGRFFSRGVSRPPRLSLHARVVLWMTAGLIALGAVAIGALEAGHALGHLRVGPMVIGALFSSVTTRTAGFNTVDFGAMRDGTLFLVCILMFIGGSPGSCAGGIKTTTAATIAAALKAELFGHEPSLGGRAIPATVLRRAIAVAAICCAIVATAVLALTLTERQPFLRLLFEATSAFGTVGLSTGITPSLTVPGKLVIVATMFVGRVGPLTIALAVGRAVGHRPYRLAQEGLSIG
ncbi:MAG: TrkH family potassium uptake protein [Deltaproteobacteria bacterium]|nr:TrkH family potassium uptake protein [Deltaproteobacteria bacterium]